MTDEVTDSILKRIERAEATFVEFTKSLNRIEGRLPNDLAEYPIDRHLREIRDELKSVNILLFIKRNHGVGGLVPGLNRLEERADDQDKLQQSIVRGLWWIAGMLLAGFGSLFWAMATEYIDHASP